MLFCSEIIAVFHHLSFYTRGIIAILYIYRHQIITILITLERKVKIIKDIRIIIEVAHGGWLFMLGKVWQKYQENEGKQKNI